MSRLVSRILLSIFMFPLAALFYLVVAIITEESMSGVGYREVDAVMFLVSGILTWVFVGVYWCMLWRSGVSWNSTRIISTIMAAFCAAVGGAVAGTLTGFVIGRDGGALGVFVGGVLAIILWLIATVLMWRETAAERAERIKGSSTSAVTCPTCGYNLTGLSESRCPECGSKFTLDELMAMQGGGEKEIE